MSALRTRPSVDKAVRRRDLASPDLWDRSLRRSRERRRVAEIHRRTAPRRKGVSLAVSAALLASPVVPRFASAHSGSGAATTEDTGGPASPQAPRAPELLERGDTGPAVERVQRELGVTADGIFGPITEAAVKRFQGHEGLPRTGKVDSGTWMKLFSGNVTVLEAGTPEAQAVLAAAGDEPTPAIAASSAPARNGSEQSSSAARNGSERSSSARDKSGPAATPAVFQPVEEESGARGSGVERGEPRRTRRASSDDRDRDRAPSKRRESGGEDRDRASTKPASDERRDSNPAPASTPAPSGGGGGGGGSCDGDFARPVDGPVTGAYGEDRGGRSHAGMDIAAPSGTPIKAATCGRVSEAGYQGGYGNIICIRASESFTTCYAHMSRFGASVGQYVKIGEVIGYVGCTGSCTGPHVHFEVRLNGQKVDPAPYINGSKRALSSRSTSTMAVSATDSTRKTPEARTAKREKVSRQHAEAAQGPARQPQISTPAAGRASGSGVPVDQAAPTTASTDETVASTPAAVDPSTQPAQAPEQEADPSAGVVEDTTGAVESTTAAVEDTKSTVEETTGSVQEDTTSAVEETTSSVEEDTTSAVEETTSTVEETTGSVQEDASSAAEETTSTVEETTGSSDEETDAPGEDSPDSSDEETDAPGEDSPDSSGDDGASDESSTEDSSTDDSSTDDSSTDDSSTDDSSTEDSSSEASGEDSSSSEEPAGATAGG